MGDASSDPGSHRLFPEVGCTGRNEFTELFYLGL